MSVLIKGINPPKSCYTCGWYNKVQCPVNDGKCYYRTTRHPNCPLIEVPTPHGRLIDADFEEQHYTSMTTNPTPDVTEQDKHNSLVIVRALQMAKTIIEAEGTE